MLANCLRAARRRLDGTGAAEDEGFVLVYVLMIISIVTVLVGSVLVVTANSVVPSVQTAYSEAATAAAQAGIQDLEARANGACTGASSTTSACLTKLPAGLQNTWIAISQPTTSYTARYKWSYAATSAGLLRVTSTGNVVRGGVSSTRTLVADLGGGTSTSCFDYSSCTQYETEAPDVLSQLYPSGRSIALDATAVANADAVKGVSGAQNVTWTVPAPASTAGAVNSCNDVYYNGATRSGRETHAPSGAPNAYVDWTETATLGGKNVTDYQPCQVTLGSGTQFLAPANAADGAGGYTTNDAPLLSNSTPGTTTGGPLLDQPVYTTYSGATDPAGTAGNNYRSLTLPGYSVPVGGAPNPSSQYKTPQTVATVPGAITTAPAVPAHSCVYRGPTRVVLNANGTATITSPMTTSNVNSSPSGCYPASLSGGIYQWTTATALSAIPAFSGVLSVLNSGSAPYSSATSIAHTSTGWATTGQRSTTAAGKSNSVFYATSGPLPSVSDPTGSLVSESGCGSGSTYSATPSAPCAWTNVASATDGGPTRGWTSYTAGTNCNPSTPLASTDRLAFECDFNGGSVGTPHDIYSIFRTRVEIDMSRSTCLSGTVTTQQTCIQNYLTTELNPANTSTHRYLVTAATPVTASTAKTLSTNAAPLSGDKFFDSTTTPGTPTVEGLSTNAFTFTISRQVNKCYGVVVLGACLLGSSVIGTQWGSDTTAGASTPQFTLTITNQTASMNSAGSVGVSSFPSMSDVTQYGIGTSGAAGTTGPGDLYVEGTPTSSLALVANDDVVVTGALAPANPASTGIEVVAQDNVRVFHPVTCLSSATPTAITNTAAGFCPNDLTGLYSSIPADGYRPYQQYKNITTSFNTVPNTINAATFALGQVTPAGLCPTWSGTGICGGQFSLDNYNRGASMSTLAVTGTVFQEHHGALGEEWEVPDTSGATRPISGATLALKYQNLKTQLQNFTSLLATGTTIGSFWHVVSTSTGGGS